MRSDFGDGLGALVLLLLAPGLASADTPRLTAVQRTGPVAIDGQLDEPAWEAAPVGDGFTERTPDPGDRPPVRTTVRVLFDESALYVGVEAFLAPGERPRALELTRDGERIFEDDAVSVKLDVRRDGRTTLGFVLNPAGAQLDYLAVDNGASFRREHDMVWQGAAHVGADRWTAEMRLPLPALGLPEGQAGQPIGLNVTRDHNAFAATYDWAATPPEFGPFSALHFGALEGVHTGRGGVPAMLTLYSLGEYRSPHPDDEHAMRGAFGGDGWVRLGADVWLEGTVYTDFSQVDLDPAVVNLNRFPLFLPEQRPFFINGLDVFTSGVPGLLQPFYSRRIGLGPEGEPLPVLGGVKLYGREGPVSFGILDVLTDTSAGLPATNDLAARARMSLDGRASYAGVVVASRTPLTWNGPRRLEGAHVTYAGDLMARVADERLELYGFGAGTAREDDPERTGGEGGAVAAVARYRGEAFRPSVSALWAGEGFEPDIGFVYRPEATRVRLELPVILRPPGDIRSLTIAPGGELQTTADFDEQLFVKGLIDVYLEVFDGWHVGAGADYIEDTVLEDFEVVPGVVARSGTWVGANLDVWIESPGQRNPVIELYYAANNAYFGGVLHNTYASVRAALGPHLSFDVSADVYRVALPEYDPFWTLALNSLLRVAPSTTLQIDALGRVETESDRATGMLRLRWRHGPGSDLFLVWRETWEWIDGPIESERTITLKTTLRFDALL